MIRYATKDDVDRIMTFIDTHWKKGHILGRDKVLFNYMYSMLNDEVNFVLSVDENNEIDAVLGFLSYDKNNKNISLAIWKTISKTDKSVGSKLQLFLKNSGKYDSIITPGINKDTRPFYELMEYETGKLNHWYRLNKKDSYTLPIVKDASIPEGNKGCTYIELPTFDDLKNKFDFDNYLKQNLKPTKSLEYFEKRFYQHPTYKYIIYGLQENDEKVKTVFVFRFDKALEKNAIRFVDCFGVIDNLKYSTELVDKLMKENDSEYTDFYEIGVKDGIMLEAGFKDVDKSGNIIPNYYQPFCQGNIDIYYSSSVKNPLVLKGDGDMDRPN